MTIYLLSFSESAYSITLYIYIYMSPSVSVERHGSLSYKGRFATFVRSCSALRASKRQQRIRDRTGRTIERGQGEKIGLTEKRLQLSTYSFFH